MKNTWGISYWHFWDLFPTFRKLLMKATNMNLAGDEDTVDLGPKQNILVLYSNVNREGKHDASGAFIPEAKSFQRQHGVLDDQCVGLDLETPSKSARRAKVYEIIHDVSYMRPIDVIAFFCHGWPDGIQLGFSREHIEDLAALLGRKASKHLKLALYACLTAENDKKDVDPLGVGPGTDGGFADELRDAMVRNGITEGWVDAHKTAGHTTWNPYVVRFRCENTSDIDYDGEGGAWLVAPRSEFWRRWVKGLRANSQGLRHQFPLFAERELKDRLSALKA